MFSGHGLESWLGGIGPRQEFVEAALRMAIDDAGDDVRQVAVGLDADKLTGFDERSDDGPMLGAAVRAGEECIFAIESERADGTLDRIGIDLDTSVFEEEAEPGPAREGIADRLGELGFLADERELFAEPWLERLDERSGAFLTDGAALVGRAAMDLGLDPIERRDPCQGFGCDRRRPALGEFVERASDVAPAEGDLLGFLRRQLKLILRQALRAAPKAMTVPAGPITRRPSTPGSPPPLSWRRPRVRHAPRHPRSPA
jgi:hypothetical protein